jgi:peptidoglycan/LPS O-acetylase OafA/YrhL
MELYDIWPYFGVLLVLLGVFSFSPVFKFIDAPQNGKAERVSTLDGLRGFLALSVFLHHAVITNIYLKTGHWDMPPSRFYAMLGQVAVSLFFMISGFLFWGKLIREQKKIGWVKLYVGRLFRIGPVYLFAVFSMLLIVFVRTDFTLREPVLKVASSIGRWLALGLRGHPDVNGVRYTTLVLTGTWTLYWEWLYYFSLRLTSFFAGRKTRLCFVLLGLGTTLALTFFLNGGLTTYIALFFAGMTTATLIHDNFVPKLNPKLAAVMALACLTLVFVFFDTVHNGVSIFLLLTFFFIVCQGNALFGLLTSKAAQRLGHISYSIYLMQGIALTVFYWPDSVRSFALSNDANFWLTVLPCALVLTISAAILHVLIERPGIALGRSVNKALAARKLMFQAA